MLGSIELHFSQLVVVLYVTAFLMVGIWCDSVYARQLEWNSVLKNPSEFIPTEFPIMCTRHYLSFYAKLQLPILCYVTVTEWPVIPRDF